MSTDFTLLTDDDSTFRQRVAEFAVEFDPSGPVERMLVEWIAREDLRLERLRVRQEAHRALMVRRARLTWDDDRALEAETLFARLVREPAKVRRALERTRHGCAALLLRWRGLERIWSLKGEWNESQKALALDLLGTPIDLRDGESFPDSNQVRHEIERLEGQAEKLSHLDRAEQAQAERGTGPADAILKGLEREEAASLRRLQWAQNELGGAPVLPSLLPASDLGPPPALEPDMPVEVEPELPLEVEMPVESDLWAMSVAPRPGVSYVAVSASRTASAVAPVAPPRKIAS